MEMTSELLTMITQICEFSTRMGVPASTSGLSGSGVPEGTILCLRSNLRVAYITSAQLGVARQTLCTIYEANRRFFDPYSSYSNNNENIILYDAPSSFTLEDIEDAIALGVCAAKANITARIAHGVSQKYLVLKPDNGRYSKDFPISELGLIRDIFEVVLQKNDDFTAPEPPQEDEPEED